MKKDCAEPDWDEDWFRVIRVWAVSVPEIVNLTVNTPYILYVRSPHEIDALGPAGPTQRTAYNYQGVYKAGE
jgi:hypothetical protein